MHTICAPNQWCQNAQVDCCCARGIDIWAITIDCCIMCHQESKKYQSEVAAYATMSTSSVAAHEQNRINQPVWWQ